MEKNRTKLNRILPLVSTIVSLIALLISVGWKAAGQYNAVNSRITNLEASRTAMNSRIISIEGDNAAMRKELSNIKRKEAIVKEDYMERQKIEDQIQSLHNKAEMIYDNKYNFQQGFYDQGKLLPSYAREAGSIYTRIYTLASKINDTVEMTISKKRLEELSFMY